MDLQAQWSETGAKIEARHRHANCCFVCFCNRLAFNRNKHGLKVVVLRVIFWHKLDENKVYIAAVLGKPYGKTYYVYHFLL